MTLTSFSAPLKLDRGWRLFLRTIWARAYPRIIGQQREKAWIFFETFLPFLATVGYIYVYRAMQAPEEYIGFVVMGGAMTAFWLNVMWLMASQLYWEKESGNLALYIMAPNSLMAILLGMALGGLLATTMRAVVITVLGAWLFDIHFVVSSYLQLLAVFGLTMAALYGLGMLLASLFLLWGREAWQIATALQEPIYFVAGFYFPVRSFGFGVGLVSSLLPLTLGLDAMRQLVFASGPLFGFLPVAVEIPVLAGLAVVFIAAAKFGLDYMERLAVREGTLTDRRR
ncbi:MAG: ABC transporter permease [Anaerolineales bacterium]|nr:ABC transporter permease [Anaerolineales bacterium]